MDDSDRFEVADTSFAFIGRTYEEYLHAFDLHAFDLDEETLPTETVLDSPAGPGSFVATAHERGASATAVDVLYDRPQEVLEARCRSDYQDAADQLGDKRDLFAWEFYGTLEERLRLLRRAYETFLDDYPEGRRAGRYVAAELPRLPFANDSFSLVLSGHFLFLYGDRLPDEFHLATLRELARVAAREVRVFPLVGLDAEPYDRLDELVTTLRDEGFGVTTRAVPFEFQRGATEMLVISV